MTGIANNLIQIKRSTNNPAIPTLANGELAFTLASNTFYIGSPADGTPIRIGGEMVPGTLTANQALVANSTSGIDQIITSNLASQELWANGSAGDAGQVLISGGAGGNLYWVGSGTLGVNTDAQYTWTNTHSFNNEVTVNGNLIVNAISANGSYGSAGQILTSNGTTVYWSSSTESPGSNTQIIFNDSGVSNGSAGFTFDKSTNVLSLGASSNNYSIYFNDYGFKMSTHSGSVTITDGNAANNTNQFRVAIGKLAGDTNQGTSDVAIGNRAGEFNQGGMATAIGHWAGIANQGFQSVAVGRFAGANTQGTGSVAIGANSAAITQGASSVAIGANSASSNQGTQSVAIGYTTGYINQGNNSVAIGTNAGYINQGINAIAIGVNAGVNGQNYNSIAIGEYAGYSNQIYQSVAIGYYAGSNNQNERAIAIGYYAGSNNQGIKAIAIGRSAGETLQGQDAVALGHRAGQSNQASRGVAIGRYAGQFNQGNNSIAIGEFAGQTNQVNNSIVLNANGTTLNATQAGLYIDPVRNVTSNSVMYYNNSTKEISYGDAANLVFSSLTVGNSSVNTYINSTSISTTDITLSGNLTVSGTLTTIDTQNLTILDPLIKLANNNSADISDIGFYGSYVDGVTNNYAGFYRSAGSPDNNPLFKIFSSTVEPTTTVTATNQGTLQAYLQIDTTSAFVVNASNVQVTANGIFGVNFVANSLTLSTALAATEGGTGQNSYSTGDLLYASSSTALSKLSIPNSVANGQILQIQNNLPTYGTLDGGTF